MPLLSAPLQRWDGSSGGTYMWKMIEEDIMFANNPSEHPLRVFIVTDGDDTGTTKLD